VAGTVLFATGVVDEPLTFQVFMNCLAAVFMSAPIAMDWNIGIHPLLCLAVAPRAQVLLCCYANGLKTSCCARRGQPDLLRMSSNYSTGGASMCARPRSLSYTVATGVFGPYALRMARYCRDKRCFSPPASIRAQHLHHIRDARSRATGRAAHVRPPCRAYFIGSGSSLPNLNVKRAAIIWMSVLASA
jgi:hypothetical protein